MNNKKIYQSVVVTVLLISNDCVTASYQTECEGDIFDFNAWSN